jgi:hypothetical protein
MRKSRLLALRCLTRISQKKTTMRRRRTKVV